MKTREPRSEDHPQRLPRLTARIYRKLLCVLAGALLLGALQGLWHWWNAGRRSPRTVTAAPALKPWGRLIVTPLRLEKPPEMLPDLAEPMRRTKWHFAGRSREATVAFLESCRLTAEQLKALTTPEALVAHTNGSAIIPSAETVVSLSRESREAIYSELAKSAENIAYQQPFRIRLALGESWFAHAGLAAEKVRLAQKLTYRRGQSLCFADAEIAHRFLSGAEFKALIRALYSSDTLLLRLRLEPNDPVEEIASYWARRWQKSSTKALLQSVANAGGGEIDIAELLPPVPRTWLYTYPNAAATAEAVADCFSTSLNFFQQTPEKDFLQPAVRNERFRRQYHVVPRADRFGDIIVFVDAAGATQHACVYVADDIVFTKNGAQNTHPWVFMHLDSIRVLYSENDEGQTHVFRLRDS